MRRGWELLALALGALLALGARGGAGHPGNEVQGVCGGGDGQQDCGVEGMEGGWRLEEAGWSYCDGHPAPGFSVTEVDLSPPRPGQELDVHVKGVTPRRVSGGRILIRALYGWFVVFTAEEDLCKRADCPLYPGPFSVRTQQKLPSIAPRGNYKAFVRVKDEAGVEAICVELHLHVEASAELK